MTAALTVMAAVIGLVGWVIIALLTLAILGLDGIEARGWI